MIAPERQLWASVLIQAINDALRPEAYSEDNRRAYQEAKAWLDRGGHDFARVCAYVGLDPVAVHEAWKAGRASVVKQKIVLAGNRVFNGG